MKNSTKRWIAGAAIAATGVAAVGCSSDSSSSQVQTESTEGLDFTVNYDGIATGNINARASVHDPSIIKVDDTYYIFGSHMVAAKTTDLRTWTGMGNGYRPNNTVWGNIFDENLAVFDYAGAKTSTIPTDDGGYHVWAPDVVYNEAKGLYYMYYCTTSTWNASNLCYATSENVEGPYEWQGALIYSGFTSLNIDETDVLDYVDKDYAIANYCNSGATYNFKEYPNAIDPSVFYDEDGRMWMVYGSWSGGMYLLEIDEETGEVIHPEADPENNVDAYFGKKLLGGGHNSIEAPYILYDEASGYYYLFVSYGGLVREGGYQIRVFRSETVDGDYVDMNGAYPETGANHSLYGLKMSGNYFLPSLNQAYMATGHNSAMIDDDGKMYICYHTRFDNGSENHSPRVKQFFLNAEGWPCTLPYTTNGETISETGYAREEVAGRYYMINQGTAIDATIAEPVIVYLTDKGNVFGEGITGTWTMTDDSYYMNITYNNKEYSGIFCKQTDEGGTEVMTFSAVGSNESIWGVKYNE